MDLLKKIAVVVVTGAVALAVLAMAISWFEMTPVQRSEMYGAAGRIVGWVGFVAILPWATFFVTTAAARRDSNQMGVVLIATYTIIDAAVLFWLRGIHATPLVGIFIAFGLLTAVAYNLLVCDWIAEKR